jgi:hypothetical protein
MLIVFAICLVVFLLVLTLAIGLVRRSNRMDYNSDNYSSSTGSWLGSSSSSYSSSVSYDFGSSSNSGSSYSDSSSSSGDSGGGDSSDF